MREARSTSGAYLDASEFVRCVLGFNEALIPRPSLRYFLELTKTILVNLDVAADAEGASFLEKRHQLPLECLECVLAKAPNLPNKACRLCEVIDSGLVGSTDFV